MRIIGVDPGLAHMGIADVSLTLTAGALRMDLRDATVVETAPANKKMGIRKSDDNMRRARFIALALQNYFTRPPPVEPVKLLVFEAQSFGMKGTVAARQAGTAFGIIAALAESYGLPILCVTPLEIKRALCPEIPKASKDDVIAAVERLWPDVQWPKRKPLWEHQADAIAVAWACRGDELVRAVLRAEAA